MAMYLEYVRTQHASGSSLMKLELLLRPGVATSARQLLLWMDADFLVRREMRRVLTDVPVAPWSLHGSGLGSTSAASLNAGFLVMRGPAPPEVRLAIMERLRMPQPVPLFRCRKLRLRQRLPEPYLSWSRNRFAHKEKAMIAHK